MKLQKLYLGFGWSEFSLAEFTENTDYKYIFTGKTILHTHTRVCVCEELFYHIYILLISIQVE